MFLAYFFLFSALRLFLGLSSVSFFLTPLDSVQRLRQALATFTRVPTCQFAMFL